MISCSMVNSLYAQVLVIERPLAPFGERRLGSQRQQAKLRRAWMDSTSHRGDERQIGRLNVSEHCPVLVIGGEIGCKCSRVDALFLRRSSPSAASLLTKCYDLSKRAWVTLKKD
jgi:hypothetical protein